MQSILGADGQRDAKGMVRQKQGPCRGFDEAEVKAFSLSFCFLNGSLGGSRSVRVRAKRRSEKGPTYPDESKLVGDSSTTVILTLSNQEKNIAVAHTQIHTLLTHYWMFRCALFSSVMIYAITFQL